MDLKARIITTTLRMMMQIGVSSMTMDAIARSCGISKRTLYEQFPDKLTLITEALRRDGQQKHERLEKIFNDSSNRLDALLNVYAEIRKQVSHTSFALISDIRRLYPSLYTEFESMRSQNGHYLIEGLKTGRSEGMVRDNVNLDIVVQVLNMTIHNPELANLAYQNDLPLVRVLDEVFINFLRSIATIQGIELIDKFFSKLYDNNNIILNNKQ